MEFIIYKYLSLFQSFSYNIEEEMDSILNRDDKDVLSNYDLNKLTNSGENDQKGATSINQNNDSNEITGDIKMEIDVKEEILDLGTDIILPQASQNTTTTHSQSQIKHKKETKTKKELEEEEREKMQSVFYYEFNP